MTGAAKFIDKNEERARKNPFAPPLARIGGQTKHDYGKHNDIDTTHGGFTAGKEARAEESAAKHEAADLAEQNTLKAQQDAAAETAREQATKAQLLKRGRRSSILTSGRGVPSEGLGNTGGGSSLFGSY